MSDQILDTHSPQDIHPARPRRADTLPTLLKPKREQRVTVLCNDGYAVAASGITHGTLWSTEHLIATIVA